MTQKITWVEDTSRFSEDNDIISFFSKNVDPCFLEQLLLSNLPIIIWKKNCFMYIYIFLTLLVKILVAASIFYFKPIGP